jgi:predicted PurR-regulated permease PerM
MAALFNIIPYLGIYIATIICVLLTLTNSSLGSAIQVGVGLLIIHFLDSNILLPRIVGSKVKINALVTVVGVVAGNMMWGVPGMFLAIPFIAILKIVFEHIEHMEAWAILLGDVTVKKATKPVAKKEEDTDAISE